MMRQPFAASVSCGSHMHGIERKAVNEYEGAPPGGRGDGGDVDVTESSEAWH